MNVQEDNGEGKEERLGRIVALEKERRPSTDVDFLYNQFHQLEFFKSLIDNEDLGELMVKEVMQRMNFVELKKNEVIFKYNELGASMFIILRGSVNISNSPYKLEHGSSFGEQHKPGIGLSKIKCLLKSSLSKILKNHEEVSYTLSEGKIIGEDEVSKNKRRQYTARCKTNCILGEITKTDYTQIFEHTQKLEAISEHKFFNSIGILHGSKKNFILRLHSILEKSIYKKGDAVVKQGDPYDSLFLIRRGSFAVTYKNKKNFFSEYDMNYFTKLNEDNERFSTNRLFELKGFYDQMTEFKLIILGVGDFMGDFELKYNSSSYFFNITCNADKSELYKFNIEKFKNNVNEHFIFKLLDSLKLKEECFKKRIEEIQKVKAQEQEPNKYIKRILKKISVIDHHSQHKRQLFKGEILIKNFPQNNCYNYSTELAQHKAMPTKSALQSRRSSHTLSHQMNSAQSAHINLPITLSPRHVCVSPLPTYAKEKERPFTSHLIKHFGFLKPNKSQADCIDNSGDVPSKLNCNYHTNSSIADTRSTMRHKKEMGISMGFTTIPMMKIKKRLFHENDKAMYSKCFEVNKKFFLENNTSIISPKLKTIFCGFASEEK